MLVRSGLQHPDLYVFGELALSDFFLKAMRLRPALHGLVVVVKPGKGAAQQSQRANPDLDKRGHPRASNRLSQVIYGNLRVATLRGESGTG
ncbi:MAG: hypothetical protein ACRDS1_10470, partial [Pseudonocardiaceae bacterium]